MRSARTTPQEATSADAWHGRSFRRRLPPSEGSSVLATDASIVLLGVVHIATRVVTWAGALFVVAFESDGPPTPETGARMGGLEGRLVIAERASLSLVLAVVAIASARYL